MALCLYRIAQEGLSNIGKHAGVCRVFVQLSAVGGDLVLSIDDAGTGIDSDHLKGRRGLGLVSMEERLRIVGGTLCISSHYPRGTHVEATVPIAT